MIIIQYLLVGNLGMSKIMLLKHEQLDGQDISACVVCTFANKF